MPEAVIRARLGFDEIIFAKDTLERSVAVAAQGFVIVAMQRVREGPVNGASQEVTFLDPATGICFTLVDRNVMIRDGAVYSNGHPFYGLGVSIKSEGRILKQDLPRDPRFATWAIRIGSLKDLPAVDINALTESLSRAQLVPADSLASTYQVQTQFSPEVV